MPADQQFMKTIIEKTMNYIAILFSIPESIDNTYTKGRLALDCCDYLLYESYPFEWYNKFASLFEKNTEEPNEAAIDNLANVFIRISETI